MYRIIEDNKAGVYSASTVLRFAFLLPLLFLLLLFVCFCVTMYVVATAFHYYHHIVLYIIYRSSRHACCSVASLTVRIIMYVIGKQTSIFNRKIRAYVRVTFRIFMTDTPPCTLLKKLYIYYIVQYCTVHKKIIYMISGLCAWHSCSLCRDC
jgi:hypothetical protein